MAGGLALWFKKGADMRIFRFVFVFLFCVFAAGVLPGCRSGARFIHAKAKVIQNIGNFSDAIELVRDQGLSGADQPKADQLRQGAVSFYADREKDLNIYGDTGGAFTLLMLAVSQPQSSSTFPLPVEMAVYTSSPHSKGETTRNGYAEIRFGEGGPVFITNKNEGFFEFTVSDIFEEKGDKIASGTFSFIARNKDDDADARRLCIMDGAYIARIK